MNGELITEEAKKILAYLKKTWGHLFEFELERPLCELFPEPDMKYLKHIWEKGSADIVVYRDGNVVAIIEPGGGHHFDKKQERNDVNKAKLCEENEAACLHLMNGVFDALSNRKRRMLFGACLFKHQPGPECRTMFV